jgi:hypothetical protein
MRNKLSHTDKPVHWSLSSSDKAVKAMAQQGMSATQRWYEGKRGNSCRK